MKKMSIFVLGLFLFGCSTFNSITGNVYAPKTADWVAQNAEEKEDVFTKTTRINFPSLIPRHFSNYKEVTGLSAWNAPNFPFWVSVIKKSGQKDLFLIYMNIDRDEWAFYDSARDENGNKLEFISLDQKVNTYGNSIISESFAIQISKEFLENTRGKNPQIKISGKRDSFIIFLPDYYIDGILQYLEK